MYSASNKVYYVQRVNIYKKAKGLANISRIFIFPIQQYKCGLGGGGFPHLQVIPCAIFLNCRTRPRNTVPSVGKRCEAPHNIVPIYSTGTIQIRKKHTDPTRSGTATLVRSSTETAFRVRYLQLPYSTMIPRRCRFIVKYCKSTR